MTYWEIPVILRFKTDHPIEAGDVKAYLRHQGTTEPCEICYGELIETPDANWAQLWKKIDQQADLFTALTKAMV